MVKSEIRKEYQQLRNRYSVVEALEIQQLINQQIHHWQITTPQSFLSYQPLLSKKELSPIALEEKWATAAEQPVKCYPKVISATEMVALMIQADTIYKANVWGIQEPLNAAVFPPEQLKALIIPLLAFDERGYRVGYGKGFYDRFLEKCAPDVLKVGICQFAPVPEIDDIHIYDVPLNYCITPERIYEF